MPDLSAKRYEDLSFRTRVSGKSMCNDLGSVCAIFTKMYFITLSREYSDAEKLVCLTRVICENSSK